MAGRLFLTTCIPAKKYNCRFRLKLLQLPGNTCLRLIWCRREWGGSKIKVPLRCRSRSALNECGESFSILSIDHLLFVIGGFDHFFFVSVRVVSWIVLILSAKRTIHKQTRSARRGDPKM